MKDKLRTLKSDLHDLNNHFQKKVDQTKRQNDENHKVYDQNALINRLKRRVEKKAVKTGTQNKTNKEVISKLEKFGYGYQKTYVKPAEGNLKRKISLNNINGKKKSRSLIRYKDNVGIDYSIKDRNQKDNPVIVSDLRGRKKKSMKRYRSVSKSKSGRRGSRIDKMRSKQLKKSKSDNIEQVIDTAQKIVGDKKSTKKKTTKKGKD
jgi:hypothetical protein